MSRRNKGRYQQEQGASEGDENQLSGDMTDDTEIHRGFIRPGLADVIAKRRLSLTEELGEEPVDPENIVEIPPEDDLQKPSGTEAEAQPEGEKLPVEAPPAEPDKPAEPAAAPPTPTEDEQIELIIDGQKVKKPKSELIEIGKKAAQKELAAEKRLEEATRIKREAEEYARSVRTAAPRTPAQEPEGTPPTPPTDTAGLDAAIREKRKALREAMNYGDEEDQEKAQVAYEDALAAKFAVGRGTPSAIDPDMVADRAIQRMAHKDIQKRFLAPVESGGFKDLWEEPEYQAQIMQEVDRAIASGADGTDWSIYESAGKKVRAYREFLKTYDGGNGSQPPASPAQNAPAIPRSAAPSIDPTLSGRADRKRQLPAVPTASGKAPAPEEDKPQTPSDVIASMRRMRPGQNL
jgi:hypothetical protein